jgi:hypothetical protein
MPINRCICAGDCSACQYQNVLTGPRALQVQDRRIRKDQSLESLHLLTAVKVHLGLRPPLDKLAQILQSHIQPILEAFAAVTHLLRHSTDPLFIEDGNSAHGHESTRNCCAKFRTQHGIVLMPHPSISPDMNPIDKCRQRIKRALHRRKYQPTNEVEMQVAVTEEWEAMPCYFREDIYFVECFLFGMLEQRNSNMLVEQSFIWILWDNFE